MDSVQQRKLIEDGYLSDFVLREVAWVRLTFFLDPQPTPA